MSSRVHSIDRDQLSANKAHGTSKITRIKVILTIAIIMSGAFITFAINGLGSNAYQSQTEGIVLDFGDYETVWTDVDYNEVSSALELLEYSCEINGYTYTFDDTGILIEVNGVYNNDDASWTLWYVEKGKIDFTEASTYNIDASDYSGTVWAYCDDGEEPAIIVDASGTCIYGYSQANRIVSLSPTATEILGSLNAINAVVGTDYYSNYPSSVVTGKNDGTIAIVGTYTDPSYESIMNTSADMVVCDSSQYNQIQMANKMRNSNVNSVLLYNGEDIETILNNIFIVGIAIGYDLRAQEVLGDLEYAVNEIEAILDLEETYTDTMISLSSDASPYVAGNYTYANDILVDVNGINIFYSMDGWIHINSEYISEYNPSVIIILSTQYSATQEDYDMMMSNLSPEWKSTDAYKSGEIYLFADGLGEMAQRAGPRFAQLMELVARVLHPDAFGDGIIVPKYLGDNYEDYLTITKNLGFDG